MSLISTYRFAEHCSFGDHALSQMQNCTALIQPILAFARHGEQIGDIVIYSDYS